MIKNLKQVCACLALLVSGVMSPASAQTAPASVKIDNQTNFNTPSMQQLVLRDYPALGARLAGSKYALWVYVNNMMLGDGRNYCVAFAGLTHPGSGGRYARIPANRFMYASRFAKQGELAAAERDECRSGVINGAIDAVAKADWKGLTAEADRLTPEAGSRKRLPANADLYRVSYLGLGGHDEVEVPADFAKAFDYREVQIVVLAGALTIDDEVVCYASAGMAARAPDQRYPRFPNNRYARLRAKPLKDLAGKDQADKENRCETDLARTAVTDMLEDSWDQKGILDGIERTREDGVPLVRQAKAIAAPAKSIRSTSIQNNVLSCTNQCTNGSCLRTFSNGRQERWQAPRVFNPFTNNWEWKTDSCGN